MYYTQESIYAYYTHITKPNSPASPAPWGDRNSSSVGAKVGNRTYWYGYMSVIERIVVPCKKIFAKLTTPWSVVYPRQG
jgi:hypothetical protein